VQWFLKEVLPDGYSAANRLVAVEGAQAVGLAPGGDLHDGICEGDTRATVEREIEIFLAVGHSLPVKEEELLRLVDGGKVSRLLPLENVELVFAIFEGRGASAGQTLLIDDFLAVDAEAGKTLLACSAERGGDKLYAAPAGRPGGQRAAGDMGAGEAVAVHGLNAGIADELRQIQHGSLELHSSAPGGGDAGAGLSGADIVCMGGGKYLGGGNGCVRAGLLPGQGDALITAIPDAPEGSAEKLCHLHLLGAGHGEADGGAAISPIGQDGAVVDDAHARATEFTVPFTRPARCRRGRADRARRRRRCAATRR
jgi:hypothetical protein